MDQGGRTGGSGEVIAETAVIDRVEAIQKAWTDFLERERIVPSPHRYVYASAYRECLLQMVRDMIEPGSVKPFEASVLANFRRGNDRERDITADLKRIGRLSDPPFEVIGEQERFELRDKKGRVAIVGKVDARLKFAGVSVPVEVKSWNPNTVARIHRFEDLFENRWTRAGAHQLLAYLFGANEPLGFLLLDRPGIPLLLPVELEANLDRLERFLQKAETALDHVEAGTLPGFTTEAEECKYCPYMGRTCNPPITHQAADLIIDDELIQKLERREALSEAADEYDALDKSVKEQLRGVDVAIAGPYLLEGHWSKTTKYEIPENIKKQYAVTDLKGKFSLKIVRV
jgi:hypothetical protein